ncbi:MAG: tail fiber domain-containing protein [Bacteroidota bacterium]
MKALFTSIIVVVCNAVSHFALSQPANDNACNATQLTMENTGCEPTTVYTYTNATPSGWGGCINATQDPDVWYKVTVPANGQFNFKMEAGPGETSLIIGSWYYGNCSSLIPFQSNNGIFCFFSLPYSGTATNLAPGSTVYMRLYKPNNTATSGSAKFCVSNNTSFADEPCNAGFIPVEQQPDPLGQLCLPTTNYTWEGTTLTPAIPNPTCGVVSPTNIRDVWFKIRVPASGKMNVNFTNTFAGLAPTIALYNATACNGTFTQFYCGLSGSNFTGLTPNSVVYCRVYQYSSTPIEYGSAKFCVSASNSVPAINNSTRIGIGIDTPFAKLDVVGTGIFRDKLTVAGDLETRGNLVVQGNIIGKDGVTSISGGQVGIDSLDIISRIGNRIALWGGLGNSPKYGFGIQSATLQMFTDAPAANIVFGHGNSYNFNERVRIINQGEYGMQITGRLQLRNGTNSSGLWLTNTDNTVNSAFIGLASDNQVGFFGGTGAQWGLTMNTTNGNVGIGLNTGQPLRPLSFPASLGEKILLYPGGAGEVGIGVYGNELRLHADNPGAKVSFGTQDNAGVYSENALAQRNGAYAFSVLGSLWVNGMTYGSDQRFKRNITPLNNSLDKLLQLNGVSYDMNTEAFPKNHFVSTKEIGLIAQDVRAIVPEVVGEKDGYLGIDYAKLVPLLIEAIKEQNKKIEKQQQEIDALKLKMSSK